MFGKKNADELLKLFSALSDEEKQKFLAGIGADKSNDEPPAETPSEEKPAEEQPDEQPAGQKEPAEEETGGAPEGVPEEQPTEENVDGEQPTEGEPPIEEQQEQPQGEQQQVEQPSEDAVDGQTHENLEVIVEGLTKRTAALEEALKGFAELKARMEEYTRKQEERFGYKPGVNRASEDIQNMSADDLKKKILNGET